MKKVPLIVGVLVILVVMEAFSLFVFNTSDKPSSPVSKPPTVPTPDEIGAVSVVPSQGSEGGVSQGEKNPDFPGPTTEVVNGRVERTIHMGVRQYVWEPATITAKKGELVRLIIHNADVLHGLVIPELGVNQDIPPDGAVVEFTASKEGSFEFFCSIWCGEGHMEMRGQLVVE